MSLQHNNDPFIIPPDRIDPLLDGDGASQRFYSWMQSVTSRIPLQGDGSPENVLGSPKGVLYIDREGGKGLRLYMKTTDEGKSGWELV